MRVYRGKSYPQLFSWGNKLPAIIKATVVSLSNIGKYLLVLLGNISQPLSWGNKSSPFGGAIVFLKITYKVDLRLNCRLVEFPLATFLFYTHPL